MDDMERYMGIGAGIAATAASLSGHYAIAAASTAAVLAAILLSWRNAARWKRKELDFTNFLRSFNAHYSRSFLLSKSISKALSEFGGIDVALKRRIQMLSLGYAGSTSSNGIGADFCDIVWFGISCGSSVLKNASLLMEREERRSKSDSEIREKTSGYDFISDAGMLFFFPLFAGISSTVLSSVLDNASQLVHGFFAVSIIYIAVMLAMRERFGGKGFGADFLFGVSAKLAISADVLMLSSRVMMSIL